MTRKTASTIAYALTAALSCAACSRSTPQQRTFRAPEDAVRALTETTKAGNVDELVAIFGADGKELVASSDPATARKNREVFTAAMAERWRLEDQGSGGKVLVIGNEDWPFPVPLVKDGNDWRFDTAAGKEEVLTRRIGRNELAVIQVCRTYVNAQRIYAHYGHDGKPAGLYAKTFASDQGKQNGLYWPASHGQKRSPLGDLVAQAAAEGRSVGGGSAQSSPFYGYYFKILTAQGPAATGGAKDYISNGELSGGFALVAWPAQYDVTGIMTFIVNHDGVLHEQALGPDTDKVARTMTAYNPDASWSPVQ
jgi:Protein of unknown function (DUF2950)